MPTYGKGEKVTAVRNDGGIFGSDVRAGQAGVVLESTLFGEHSRVLWDNGEVSEVPNETIHKDFGGVSAGPVVDSGRSSAFWDTARERRDRAPYEAPYEPPARRPEGGSVFD